MVQRITTWVKRHPIWSGLIVLILLFVVYRIVRPAPHEYEYVSEPVTQGEVLRKVSASGKVRALNTIKVGTEVSGQVTKVKSIQPECEHAFNSLKRKLPLRAQVYSRPLPMSHVPAPNLKYRNAILPGKKGWRNGDSFRRLASTLRKANSTAHAMLCKWR